MSQSNSEFDLSKWKFEILNEGNDLQSMDYQLMVTYVDLAKHQPDHLKEDEPIYDQHLPISPDLEPAPPDWKNSDEFQYTEFGSDRYGKFVYYFREGDLYELWHFLHANNFDETMESVYEFDAREPGPPFTVAQIQEHLKEANAAQVQVSYEF